MNTTFWNSRRDVAAKGGAILTDFPAMKLARPKAKWVSLNALCKQRAKADRLSVQDRRETWKARLRKDEA